MHHIHPVLALICLTAACAPQSEDTRVDVFRGQQLFQENCAVCHGARAMGGGPASLGLGAPPPSLRNLSTANGGNFPRDYVLEKIDGLARHSDPAAAMPEFGAGDLGPIIQVENDGLSTPIPADLLAIANYLETLQTTDP